MSNFTPGKSYRFRPKPGKYTQMLAAVSVHTRTLTYLRDELGDWRPRGKRVVLHVFQWRGGALECFTDEQAADFIITEK